MADSSPAPANTMISAADPRPSIRTTIHAAMPRCENLAQERCIGELPDGPRKREILRPRLGDSVQQHRHAEVPNRAYGDNLAADRVEDFLLPALPATVTITGKVTNPDGLGLKGVTVSAETDQLANTSGLGFSSSAVTDDAGNYTLTVLGGTAYKVTFAPSDTVGQ